MRTFLFLLAVLLTGVFAILPSSAQMDRQRAVAQPVEFFWSPSVILLPSTTSLKPGDLDFTIHHTFGPVSGGMSTLFGLDDAANIRFGLDYGVTPWAMVGVGRSRFNKTVDFRAKARVWNKERMQASMYYNMGIETLEDGREMVDRMSYHASAFVAHRVTEDLVVQLAPGFTRFVFAPDEPRFDGSVWQSLNNHWSVGSALHYELKENVAVTGEYLAVLGERTDETTNVFSVGVDIETGGHVFQMFFSSSQWITPQHAVAWTRNPLSDMDFGWGFNVHRVFGTGR
ncbi:MAG: DUF5777 family beta-barrel protein [Bacteroidetes bacterium]|nr:DUF5777 family beta-barrel protein [Bacteroidota bacterium]MDA0874911.1 DUF5777 family beta-barrel protein [Bacteroidota bacterium]